MSRAGAHDQASGSRAARSLSIRCAVVHIQGEWCGQNRCTEPAARAPLPAPAPQARPERENGRHARPRRFRRLLLGECPRPLDPMMPGSHLTAIRTALVRNASGAMLRLSKLTDYAVVVMARLSSGMPTQTSPGHRRCDRHPGADRRQGAEDAGGRRAGRVAARCARRLPADPAARGAAGRRRDRGDRRADRAHCLRRRCGHGLRR